MSVAPRLRPLDLFTKGEWEKVSKRSNLLGLGMVVHCWAIILGAIALSVWQPWLIILAIPIIGARQLGLAVLMHEAAHGGLHSNQKINDWVGHWLVGAPIGASLKAYRPYHLMHHKYGQQPEDPDLGLAAHFPITKSSLRRKIIRDLTGQTFYKQRVNQFANALGLGIKPGKGRENRTISAREAVIPFLMTNIVLLVGLSLAGVWWTYFVLWLLPMATWDQMVTRLRNIAEHAVLPNNQDAMGLARTTRANLIERALIAPYWVNYHCEHHMFMHVPCYRFPQAHRFLRDKGLTEKMEIKPGYLTVLQIASSRPEKAAA